MLVTWPGRLASKKDHDTVTKSGFLWKKSTSFKVLPARNDYFVTSTWQFSLKSYFSLPSIHSFIEAFFNFFQSGPPYRFSCIEKDSSRKEQGQRNARGRKVYPFQCFQLVFDHCLSCLSAVSVVCPIMYGLNAVDIIWHQRFHPVLVDAKITPFAAPKPLSAWLTGRRRFTINFYKLDGFPLHFSFNKWKIKFTHKFCLLKTNPDVFEDAKRNVDRCATFLMNCMTAWKYQRQLACQAISGQHTEVVCTPKNIIAENEKPLVCEAQENICVKIVCYLFTICNNWSNYTT